MNILLETTSCEGWTESGTDRSVYFCIDDFLNTTIQMNNSCSLVSLLLLFSLISFKFLFKELISAIKPNSYNNAVFLSIRQSTG